MIASVPLPLTIIIPMRNAVSTINETLDSISKQTYPIRKIIVIDNQSTDNSYEVVNKYIKSHPKMNIKLLVNEKDLMIARSYMRGVLESRTPYIIFTQADCRFLSPSEIKKLVLPIEKNRKVIASYGEIITPFYVWREYSFWEKCLFAHQVGVAYPGMVGKIDCFEKKTFLNAGGHDTVSFADYGCEDADLYMRLQNLGEIAVTKARVEHLHYLYKDFSIIDLFKKKKFTSNGYGRLLRVHGLKNGFVGITAMIIKIILSFGVFIPYINIICIPLLILSPFIYYRKMFIGRASYQDWRIIILPIVGILLMYYESFWVLYTFFEPVKVKTK